MARTATRLVTELEGRFVLAPERYDPRRSLAAFGGGSVPLRSLVSSIRQAVGMSTGNVQPCLVFDTSEAQEGIIVNRKPPIGLSEIGSAKKELHVGDVLVSRLRPYLRQVAYIDADIRYLRAGVPLLCSTEFFVLRAADAGPIAFLMPFLLSKDVQQVLAAAQEGGHHPRVPEATVLGLPVPAALVARRDELSKQVETGIVLFRQSERTIAQLIEGTEAECRFVPDNDAAI